jgi:hypothetical protein
MMRQLARTVTDQNPFRPPLSGCRRYPRRFRSWGVAASSSTVNFLNRIHQIRTYAAAVVTFEEPLQASMLEASHHLTIL